MAHVMSATAPVPDMYEATPGFQHILEWQGITSDHRCLLIIDAARYEEGEVLRQIYTLDDDPDWLWLFDQTPFEQDRDAGPIVVDTTLDSALAQDAAGRWAADEAVLVLVSDRESGTALAGFRQSLLVQLDQYGPCFLRPYDNRFLAMLAEHRPEELVSLIGKGDLLMWSIDREGVTEWSGTIGTSTDFRGLGHTQDASFERLLGSVRGLPG
ncbi:DUF4123 domain-containing protein [Marinobacter pelagius]|uniref:DUF4123 domain-containing protein n=1 Tax=Marinobacter sp. C7 TaxID=2951363 RepID=UPI001EEFF4CF|nr:DUF4123 domain-containing protein [Marinobacter sp. C7]MCG7198095.1 DUF4123 domain-containing protein [Marinobacter sp. C7]